MNNIIIRCIENNCNTRISPTRAAWCNDDRVPRGEIRIRWVVNPAPFPFVRVAIVRAHFRTRRPRFITDGIIVGYSVLGESAPKINDRFLMRIFYLQAADLQPDCPYRRRDNFLPFEGVQTDSIRPGIWGVLA